MLALAVSFITVWAQSTKTETANNFEYQVKQTSGWVFYAPHRPILKVVVVNNRSKSNATLQLTITTDQYVPISIFSQSVALQMGDSTQINFSFTLPEPGFYRCTLAENNQVVKRFNIGYEPENIVSLPDNQPDLKAFWDQARTELSQIEPAYQLTLIPDSSNNVRKLYRVKMKSLGNVEVAGYYSTPAKKGKYPAIISYMGYGSKPYAPHGNPNYVEFVLSVRGQAMNQSTNMYGDWITYNLNDKDNYYYRGAFMDLIRAIDFVSSRPEVRTDAIFAEGGSQGGAFSMAAAALDNRLRAIAPAIPFLSDFPDYFRIVQWPASVVLRKQKELGMSDVDMYRTLSYFDIKNLAGWIQCPVIMGVGLQDEVCPPHTNFAGYNRISSEKKYFIYPLNGHSTPASWQDEKMSFFKKFQ